MMDSHSDSYLKVLDERRSRWLARIREGTIDEKNPSFAVVVRFAAAYDVVTPKKICCALRAAGRGRPPTEKGVGRGTFPMWLYDGFDCRIWSYAPGILSVAFDRIGRGKYVLRQDFRAAAVASAMKGE